MAKTILQAIKDKLSASGVTVADGLDGKGLTISEAIDELELGGGGITPTGTITITSNNSGNTIDVSQYEKALIEVAAFVVTFDVTGAQSGVVSPEAWARGTSHTLPTAEWVTPPEGKVFAGWHDLSVVGDEVTHQVGHTYQFNSDFHFKAVWVDA